MRLRTLVLYPGVGAARCVAQAHFVLLARARCASKREVALTATWMCWSGCLSCMPSVRSRLDVEGTRDGGTVSGTCNVKLSEAFFRRTEAPSEKEKSALATALDVKDTS
ncbi:hypothetical protein GH5_01628 [Leishmania sp. Ghana 2012 LV757]|uniref:hypothetical protein n=1 Tax=Leishmania sp. Ghana 2012 LV757 TaxID=2803181 RepID=UPI001B5AF139|nr:hypothetical protein GH5_01628 [Leishmania sp. Ghana 2012 LV757]